MKNPCIWMAIALLALGAFPAQAQNTTVSIRPAPVAGLTQADAEYRLGPGDLIEVTVFGVEQFRHTVRVDASGLIKLPLLESITAAGLTPAALEQRLTELLDADLIKNPQVSVFVKEYRSQPIYLLGAVRTPGQYQITLQLRIVDAIALAGGLGANAGDEAMIQRPSRDGGEQMITVDLKALLETGDLQRNVVVQGGDVIHIKERLAETIYVIGDVNRSGAYVKNPRQELRLSQLIAWAGGPTKTARLSKGILVRYKADGQREELPVDFGQILKGKKEDFFVRANDIVFVPGSRFKDLRNTVLTSLTGTVAALPYMIP